MEIFYCEQCGQRDLANFVEEIIRTLYPRVKVQIKSPGPTNQLTVKCHGKIAFKITGLKIADSEIEGIVRDLKKTVDAK